jgi:hypothetical protein
MRFLKNNYGLIFDDLLIMEAKKYLSQILRIKNGSQETSKGIKNTATVFAVGILALFAFGVFTTSQRLNAG